MSELTIKDFKSKYQPIGLSMELNFQGQSAYETGKIGGHTPLYTDEQIQDYLSNQPQLTIPESIADELDGYFKYKNPFEAILRDYSDYSVRSNDVIEELRDYLDFLHSNLKLCIAYLAGKALGVDLVKVVEG